MTTPTNGPPTRYRFADLALDTGRRRVTRGGEPLELGPLDFDLLKVLVESAPHVVSYDELAEKVWHRHFVSPENVVQRAMLLRRGLSDDASRPRYVEAIRSRGYRLIPAVEVVPAADRGARQRSPLRWRRTWTYWLIGSFIVALAWVVYRIELGSVVRPSAAPPDVLENSVAVLPLQNLSPDPDKSNIVIGLHHEIVNQLTRLPHLNVIAAASVLQYADNRPPIAEIARALNVETVMEGSVRYSGDDIRVTMWLRDARTGANLWSDTYEREFSDIFAIESDIARNVARVLEAALLSDERDVRFRAGSTTSAEAYELYLAAQGFASRGFEQSVAAFDLLDRALDIDERFVDAWLAKANLHSIRAGLVAEGADAHERAAVDAASKALEIDSGSWRAHLILSFVLGNQGRWQRAAEEYGTALELGMPMSLRAGSGVHMAAVGDFAGARDVYRSTLRIDPMNPIAAGFLLAAREMVRDSVARRADYERGEKLYGDWLGDAIELLLRLGDRDTEFLRRRDFSVDTAFISGPYREIHLAGQRNLDAPHAGLDALRALYADHANSSAGALTYMAAWVAYFGDAALAMRMMTEAIDRQPSRVMYLWLPIFDAARRESGFKELIRDLDLVAYWHAHGWPDLCRPLGATDFECR